jgi:hypothetical protein
MQILYGSFKGEDVVNEEKVGVLLIANEYLHKEACCDYSSYKGYDEGGV